MSIVSVRNLFVAAALSVPALLTGCCNNEAATCTPVVTTRAPAYVRAAAPVVAGQGGYITTTDGTVIANGVVVSGPAVAAPAYAAGAVSYDPTPVVYSDTPSYGYSAPMNVRVIGVSGPMSTSETPNPSIPMLSRGAYEAATAPVASQGFRQGRRGGPGRRIAYSQPIPPEFSAAASAGHVMRPPVVAAPGLIAPSAGNVVPAVSARVDSVSVTRQGTADILDGGPAALASYDRPETIAAAYPDLSAAELVNYAVGQHVNVPVPVGADAPSPYATLENNRTCNVEPSKGEAVVWTGP